MTETELEVAGGRGAIQLLLDLEAAGAVDEVSLTLTDPEMPYTRWEDLGRFLGNLDRRSRWYIGDWMNFGEAVYGEQAAQGVDATTADRYNEAERVTGLDHQTLINIRSICARVPRERRRKELGFWVHAEVAALVPEDQVEWLQRAIDEGWTRSQLRAAIRESKNPAAPPAEPEPVGGDGGPTPLSRAERLEAAARVVYNTAQTTSDGSKLVPAEAWAQLAEALGEEN